MWFFGRSRGQELIGKATSLQGLATTKDVLGQLYGILTILDAKATGLLTVNALFIAILSAFLASIDTITKLINAQNLSSILEIQLALSAISAFLCLLVVRVTWKFFAYVPTAPASAAAFDAELRRLPNVIDDRTHYYWMAWLLSVSAFVLTLAWWSWWYALIAAIVILAWLLGRG